LENVFRIFEQIDITLKEERATFNGLLALKTITSAAEINKSREQGDKQKRVEKKPLLKEKSLTFLNYKRQSETASSA